MKSIFIVVIIGLLVPVIILLLDKYRSYFEGAQLSPIQKEARKARRKAKKAAKRAAKTIRVSPNTARKARIRAEVKNKRAEAALLRPKSKSVRRRLARDERKVTGKLIKKTKRVLKNTGNIMGPAIQEMRSANSAYQANPTIENATAWKNKADIVDFYVNRYKVAVQNYRNINSDDNSYDINMYNTMSQSSAAKMAFDTLSQEGSFVFQNDLGGTMQFGSNSIPTSVASPAQVALSAPVAPPIAPIVPVAPVRTVAPIVPVAPVRTVAPIVPVAPAQVAKPVTPSPTPVAPAQVAKPVTPSPTPVAPVRTVAPIVPVALVRTVAPIVPVAPAQVAKTVTPSPAPVAGVATTVAPIVPVAGVAKTVAPIVPVVPAQVAKTVTPSPAPVAGVATTVTGTKTTLCTYMKYKPTKTTGTVCEKPTTRTIISGANQAACQKACGQGCTGYMSNDKLKTCIINTCPSKSKLIPAPFSIMGGKPWSYYDKIDKKCN